MAEIDGFPETDERKRKKKMQAWQEKVEKAAKKHR